MATMLDRVSRFARDYQGDAESAWETVKREHDGALIACAIDDAVAFACFVLTQFPKAADRWHQHVSEDVSRYNEASHRQLQAVEAAIVASSEIMLRLIGEAELLGYEVTRAGEFRELAEQLFLLAGTSAKSPGAAEIREAKRIALDDYRAGRTTTIAHWGE